MFDTRTDLPRTWLCFALGAAAWSGYPAAWAQSGGAAAAVVDAASDTAAADSATLGHKDGRLLPAPQGKQQGDAASDSAAATSGASSYIGAADAVQLDEQLARPRSLKTAQPVALPQDPTVAVDLQASRLQLRSTPAYRRLGLEFLAGIGSNWNTNASYDAISQSDAQAVSELRVAYTFLRRRPIQLSAELGYEYIIRDKGKDETFDYFDINVGVHSWMLGLRLNLALARIAHRFMPYVRLGFVQRYAWLQLEVSGSDRLYEARGFAPGLYAAAGLQLGRLNPNPKARYLRGDRSAKTFVGWGFWLELRGHYGGKFSLQLEEKLDDDAGGDAVPAPIGTQPVRLGGLSLNGMQLLFGFMLTF